jgi:peptide/nickel transport system permease protein
VLRYALRRLLGAVPLVLGVLTILFVVLHLAPGDPMPPGGFGARISPEALEQWRRLYGLDQPILGQYLNWLGSFVRGDFGPSLIHGRPVAELVSSALPNTVLLTSCALGLAFLLGIAIGILQAVRQNTVVDGVLGGGSLFFYSMPSFWLALMLILVFSVWATDWAWLPALPASGMVDAATHELMSPLGRVLDRIEHLVLPVLSLTLVLAAGIARYVRSGMLEVIRQDYIRTARGKGLPETQVILKHALRNALIPVVTLFGLYFPFLLGGTVFVEEIFAWPGMGKLVVDSITQLDYAVVMAGAFIFSVMVVVGNLLADLCYALVDPRIRYGRQGGRP